MIRLPLKYRSDDDDYAPIDYHYVGSVSEGQRQKEAQAIHKRPEQGVVRHRVDPHGRVDEYGTHARRSNVVQRPDPRPIPRELPSMEDGPPPAASIAYPEGMAPPPAMPVPQRVEETRGLSPASGLASEDRERAQEENLSQTPEGEMFDEPAKLEMPEWLRVAQQNNLPADDPARRRPQVVAAPKQQEEPEIPTDILGRPILNRTGPSPFAAFPQKANEYEDAGYPPELLAEQQRLDEENRARMHANKRHGAQRAVQYQQEVGTERNLRPTRAANAPVEDSRSSYPPARTPGNRPPQPYQDDEGVWGEAPAEQRQGSGRQLRRSPRAYPEQEGFDAYGNPLPGDSRGYGAREYEQQGYPAQSPDSYAPQAESSPYPPSYGAGYAPREDRQRPARRPAPARRESARMQQGEAYDEYDPYEEEPVKRNIPWLGIAAAGLAFVAVLLWILQMTFTAQTESILTARAETEEAIENSHPYRYREIIETQAQVNNLHPAFIAAIVLNESSFNPSAESSVGARGLMQMMPDTAEWVHGKIAKDEDYSFDMMYDPQVNVRYACWYMNFLCEKFWGDPVLVAAAFHAGQGTVQNWLNDSRYSSDNQTIALEDMMDGPTKNYVTKVQRAYAVYKRLYYEDVGGV